MKALARVVWSEGMHLSQHHFQAQSDYFEEVTGATLSSLFHAPYGLLNLQLDDEALLNGTAAVVSARGIMPDGTPFNFPDGGPPEPLRIGDTFSPTQSSHVLLLALPDSVPGRANCDMGSGVPRNDDMGSGVPRNDDMGSGAPRTDPSSRVSRSALRFTAEERDIADETTGMDQRPVQVARKNYRLLLDIHPTDGLVTLPIARVQRDGAGHFVYNYSFIGPCMRLAANRRLREVAARIVEMLESRSDAVMQERAAAGSAQAEYAPREIAGFWFLHALNSAIPLLRHSLRTGSAHPEQLYTQLCQLAGALCTFSLTSHPRELPLYDHDSPEQCFAALERHIRQHLDVILPSGAITLPLRQTQESLYLATVHDPRCLEAGARWFLGLRSSAPAGEVIAKTGRLVKLCSAKFIARLVKEAYPGLGIDHVPVPPAELSPRIGTHYFAVQRTGQCWKSIVDTSEVGLYLPGVITDPEVELKVVLERRD